MNQQDDSNPEPVPTDAREPTEAQRAEEEELEQGGADPAAPGGHQSAENTADESRR